MPFPSTKIHSVYDIPPTPKADMLHDHFGTRVEDNWYGNMGTRGLNSIPYGFTLSDGTKYSPLHFSEVSRNFPENEPDIDPWAKKIRKTITADDQPCIIELLPWFDYCSTLATCEQCTANARCG